MASDNNDNCEADWGEFSHEYLRPLTWLKFPLASGDSWSDKATLDTRGYSTLGGDSTIWRERFYTWANANVYGYGTLIAAGDTIEHCLMVVQKMERKDDSGRVVLAQETRYTWVRPHTKWPVAVVHEYCCDTLTTGSGFRLRFDRDFIIQTGLSELVLGLDRPPFSKGISVYPNPAQSTIHFSDPVSGQMRLFNHAGMLLADRHLNEEDSMELRHLPDGVYFLLFGLPETHKALRVVKTSHP